MAFLFQDSRVGVPKSRQPGQNMAKHPKWSQVPLPFEKWIVVVQAKSALCAGREDEGHTFEGMT
jgi:hypothetical protein